MHETVVTERDMELAKACMDEYFEQIKLIGPRQSIQVIIAKYLAHAREQQESIRESPH